MIKGCGSASDEQLKELAMKYDSVYLSKVSELLTSATKTTSLVPDSAKQGYSDTLFDKTTGLLEIEEYN